LDGTEIYSGNAGAIALRMFQIGRGVSSSGDADIFEIIVYDGNESVEANEAGLMKKWGIPYFWDAFTGDDFTGNNGDDPNPVIWSKSINSGSDYMSIQNNKLNFNSPGDNANHDNRANGTFTLTGDFDIQIDFDVTTFNQPTDSVSYIYLGLSGSTFHSVSRIRNTDGTNGYGALGSGFSLSNYNNAADSGKLRLTRVGSIIKGFIWSGAQWEWDGNEAGITISSTGTGNMRPILKFEQENNGSMNVNMDNFIINSGTVVAP
jgi:hypothetical protein